MIYTITLNPALDCTIYTNHFVVNERNHYYQQKIYVGGKGINVAIILNRLGDPVTAIGLFGAENRDVFAKKFKQEKLHAHMLSYPGSTRINYKIKNLMANEETELDGKTETKISPTIIKHLFSYLQLHLVANDIVIISGSIPSGLEANIYQNLGKLVHEKNATLFLDGTKEPLREGLKAKPYLIKPNLAELKETFGLKVNSNRLNDIIEVIRNVSQHGAQNVLLSMGGEGSYLFADNGSIYKVGIAKGKLVNSVGAGDSMLAGFVHGLVNHLPIEDTLKYAAASGGATAFSEELASRDLINHYQSQIRIEKVKGKTWK